MSNDSIVAKPLTFNGSITTHSARRQSLSLYMAVHSTKFPDDQIKITCALSCMTEGTASIWAQTFFEDKNTTGTSIPGTWSDFNTSLNTAFKDLDL